MADVKPFRGLRPQKHLADKVAAPPYDVLNSEEARQLAKDNPYSFLHINKPEISLPPEVDLYDDRVYQKGAENLRKMIDEKIVVQDDSPHFYVYKQVMGSHEQVGLVACASVEDYENDIIKKHEFTRPDKEDDRVKHIDHQNAQVGPVFLTYHANQTIDTLTATTMQSTPEYDITGDDGVRHTLWIVDNADTISTIQNTFAGIDYLYVADGHHRSAAAMRVKQQRQAANASHSGEEEYNYFLVVIFPHNQMQILDYNRLVKDLNGRSKEEFLKEIAANFSVTKLDSGQPYKPQKAHEFGMYLQGDWYKLETPPGSFDPNDPVGRLDVSILQENLLSPILGIKDQRKDKRIDFVGGIRGLGELKKRVDSGDWAVAFALFPTAIEDLIAIADAGEVMPPKSTWFEPKLKSGLVVHLLG